MVKIVIFGNGNVATETVRALYEAFKKPNFIQQDEKVEIYMVGRNWDRCAAKLSDIAADNRHNSLAFLVPTTDPSMVKGADVVVFAMGVSAGKTGATDRNKNLSLNMEIIETYAPYIKRHANYALILMLSNPVELLVYRMQQLIGCANDKILGLGLELDCRRFAENLALRLQARIKSSQIRGSDIGLSALGMHSAEGMIFLTEQLRLLGADRPFAEVLREQYGLENAELQNILLETQADTRPEGMRLVYKNDGKGASYGPGSVARDLILAYLYDEKISTCAAINVGDAGYMQVVPPGYVMGVPVTVCRRSIQIEKIFLTTAARELLAGVCERYENARLAYVREQKYRSIVFTRDNPRGSKSSIFIGEGVLPLNEARVLYLAGQYAESARLLGQHKIISRSSTDILRIELDLGMCFYMQALYDEAFHCFKRAFVLWKALHSERRYAKERQILEQAIAMFEAESERPSVPEVLKIDKKLPTNFLGDISRIFNNLGNLCQTPQLFFMKFLLYQTAAAISQNRENEPNSSDLYHAIAKANLASLLVIKGKFEEAQREHLAVIGVLNAYFSSDIHEGLQTRGSAYNELGNMYFYKGDYQAALDCYLYAKELLTDFSERQHQGTNHPDLALCCFNLGMCYFRLGDQNLAIAFLETAKNSFEKSALQIQVGWCVQRLDFFAERNFPAYRARL